MDYSEQIETAARPRPKQEAMIVSQNLNLSLSKFQNMIKEVEKRFAEREQNIKLNARDSALPSYLQVSVMDNDGKDSESSDEELAYKADYP